MPTPISGTSGSSGVSGVQPPAASSTSTGTLSTKKFGGDATLQAIVAGSASPIIKGAPKDPAVETVQLALYSLDLVEGMSGVDGCFGPKTLAALQRFQLDHSVPPSGAIDAATLVALDKAMVELVKQAKSEDPGPGNKRTRYSITVDMANPQKTRLYVLDKAGAPIMRFLTSPGTAEHPTQGTSFSVDAVKTRAPWNPPDSDWAANAQVVPPGINNPMGILKFSLGQYAQYIHGIPFGEEQALGRAASHGCCRVSGSNILKLWDYIERGTKVAINRDAAQSATLASAAASAGVTDAATDVGRERLFGFVSGELG